MNVHVIMRVYVRRILMVFVLSVYRRKYQRRRRSENEDALPGQSGGRSRRRRHWSSTSSRRRGRTSSESRYYLHLPSSCSYGTRTTWGCFLHHPSNGCPNWDRSRWSGATSRTSRKTKWSTSAWMRSRTCTSYLWQTWVLPWYGARPYNGARCNSQQQAMESDDREIQQILTF